MKKLLVVLIVALVTWMTASAAELPKMRLRGEYPSAQDGVTLYLVTANDEIIDSAVVRNGKFEFALKNIDPDEYILRRLNKEGKQDAVILIYLDNYDTDLKLEQENYVLGGHAFIKYTSVGNPTQLAVRKCNELLLGSNDGFDDPVLHAEFAAVAERGDMATAYVMWKYAQTYLKTMKPDEIKRWVNHVNASVKQTPVGKRFVERYKEFMH